jgi:hypothetical protein
MVSYLILDSGRFHVLARVPVRGGDSGTTQGQQTFAELFEADVVSREAMKRAFGL